MIIDAQYRGLSHLAVASNHIGKLRQSYDTIERHLHSLEALGKNIEHRHFVSLITENLPPEVLYQLYLMKGEEPWTVKNYDNYWRNILQLWKWLVVNYIFLTNFPQQGWFLNQNTSTKNTTIPL